MKNLKKVMGLMLALVLCLSMSACGKKVSIEDLEGFWYPAEGIGSTMSVLICIYIDGTAGTWEEYDQYGDPTDCTGAVSTDGKVLTLADVPLLGDVDIPIGDADTLVTDTGEPYWIKGEPDFQEKPELSSAYYGNWYLRGDHDSEYATVLTLQEDGTYTRGDLEEGTYTYREYEESVGDTGTTVFRQEIALSGGMAEMYYLASDGQALVHWADDGDNYYIHEDALDNVSLLTEYHLTNGDFWGEDYILIFDRAYTVSCDFFSGESRTGTWEADGNTVRIFWDDGETDEAELNWKTLSMSSTGETLENPW